MQGLPPSAAARSPGANCGCRRRGYRRSFFFSGWLCRLRHCVGGGRNCDSPSRLAAAAAGCRLRHDHELGRSAALVENGGRRHRRGRRRWQTPPPLCAVAVLASAWVGSAKACRCWRRIVQRVTTAAAALMRVPPPLLFRPLALPPSPLRRRRPQLRKSVAVSRGGGRLSPPARPRVGSVGGPDRGLRPSSPTGLVERLQPQPVVSTQ